MSYVVYQHISPEGKIYTGITSDVSKRWANGYGYRSNPEFFADIQKFGWDKFQHNVLQDSLSKDEAEEFEGIYTRLSKSNTPEHGYNKAEHGTSGYSDEYKEEQIIKRGRRKSVQKLDNFGNVITTYKSLNDACQQNNGISGSLSACLNGRMKSYLGCNWRYTPSD